MRVEFLQLSQHLCGNGEKVRNSSLICGHSTVRRQNSSASNSACRQIVPLTSWLNLIATASRRILPLPLGANAIGNMS
ncbi:hypothetical protein [Serratia symbiotica]|uniref:hypothetical protein n=1 Tax=Serratia symbiotica TaxID=138074 RepID=UPI0030D1D624|nr:hypothetical protein [Serratia symbiotica]